MNPMSTATVNLIIAETKHYEYIETNGNDGSEELQALRSARDAAAQSYEEALADFVDARA